MRALGLLVGVLVAAAGARAADDISVETIRRDSAVEVRCLATLQAPLELIWRALTDYNRLAEFIPGMRSSRLLERRGPIAVVEQSGEVRFLFLSFPIEVTLASVERPPHAIDVYALKGNLKRFEGGYRVEPRDRGQMLLRWQGIIEPEAPMPPLIGELLMRAAIEDQFRGMVREIERRDALRREREKETAQ